MSKFGLKNTYQMQFDFKGFNWGKFAESSLPWELDQGVYDSLSRIKENDIVVDIGAGVGIIPWGILTNGKNPKRIHMVEPYPPNHYIIEENIKTLERAFPGIARRPTHTCSIIKESISDKNGPHQISWGYNPIVSSLKFKTLQSEYFDRIDFLKIDIEGDEYHIFTKENLDFLNNNTGIIHCEFHLQIGGGPNKEANLKERFRYFRDNILPQINKEFEVLAVCGTNVTWDLYNEHFMEYYDCVVFVFDNKPIVS